MLLTEKVIATISVNFCINSFSRNCLCKKSGENNDKVYLINSPLLVKRAITFSDPLLTATLKVPSSP